MAPTLDQALCAVAGASGFVGRRLVERLAGDGHRVRALARRPGGLPSDPLVEPLPVDVGDTEAAARALAGVDTAYYLVHAMADGAQFAERDRATARAFAGAAARSGVRRIIYVGALGHDGAESDHLASRHEVGEILRGSGVPVVELRAAVVIGSGSISYEMLRYLTERLPVMVCPRWVRTHLQPVAESDLVEGLLRAQEAEPGIYELGTPDVTTYLEMMRAYARARGLPRRRIVTIPLLTPALSAHWVDLVTPVDRAVSHALVESLRHDVVVHRTEASARALGIEPLTVSDAIARAIDEQARAVPAGLFERPVGLSEGVYTMRARTSVSPEEGDAVREDLPRAGADLDWYGVRWAWRLRVLLGRMLHEDLTLERPGTMTLGSDVDWWRVASLDHDAVVFASRAWRFGDAWLGYRVEAPEDRGTVVVQVAAFRPKGVVGLAYWRLLWPVHLVVLRAMARHRRIRVTRPAGPRWRRAPRR